jgi:hypothetical protein
MGSAFTYRRRVVRLSAHLDASQWVRRLLNFIGSIIFKLQDNTRVG